VLVAVILTPLLLYHEAFNPAILSEDSNTHIAQAIGALELSDWHSPLYTLCIRFLLGIHPQISFVLVVQLVLVSCALATCAMLLHRLGVSFYALCVGVCAFVMMPTNGLQINTIWKDIPFCACMLLLTYSFLRILEELDAPTARKGVLLRQTIFCGLSMAAIFLFRQNGVAPFIGAAVVLLVLTFRYRRWVLLGALAAATLIVVAVRGPVYNTIYHVEHEEMSGIGKYYGLIHDIHGVYNDFGSFSRDDKALLDQVIPDIEMKREEFKTFVVDWGFYDLDDLTPPQFAKLYLDTFLRNPLLTLRGLLTRCDGYWSILLRDQHPMSVTAFSEDYVMKDLYFEEEISELGLLRRESFFTDALRRLIDFSTEPIPSAVFWSLGLWVVVLLFAVFHCAFRKKGRILLALAPLLCNHVGLLFTIHATDYRYGYATFLIGAFFIVYALAYRPKSAETSGVSQAG
jgi:hypothetical protein